MACQDMGRVPSSWLMLAQNRDGDQVGGGGIGIIQKSFEQEERRGVRTIEKNNAKAYLTLFVWQLNY